MIRTRVHGGGVVVAWCLAAAIGCGSGGPSGGGDGSTDRVILIKTLTFTNDVRGGAPRFSPDGALLAYRRHENDADGVAVMTPAGANSRTLASDGSYLTAETWSHDGAEVIYYDDTGIRAVPVAGGAGRAVVGAFAAMGPDLSPDGNWLVYGENGSTMHLADLRPTPALETDLGVPGSSPRFSPDGASIAFFDGVAVSVMNLGTKAVTKVVDSDNAFGGVDWFSDGRRLVAGTDRGLEILTLGPPVQRDLVRDVFAIEDVDLSPDDKTVAYGVNGQAQLYLLTGF